MKIYLPIHEVCKACSFEWEERRMQLMRVCS